MKREQILEVCEEYDEMLKNEGFIIEHRIKFEDDHHDMNHIRWMLNEIPKIIDIPCKIEKVNRWLGFIQGALWVNGFYTIEEMKGHNRSGNECKEEPKETPSEQHYPFEGGDINIELK